MSVREISKNCDRPQAERVCRHSGQLRRPRLACPRAWPTTADHPVHGPVGRTPPGDATAQGPGGREGVPYDPSGRDSRAGALCGTPCRFLASATPTVRVARALTSQGPRHGLRPTRHRVDDTGSHAVQLYRRGGRSTPATRQERAFQSTTTSCQPNPSQRHKCLGRRISVHAETARPIKTPQGRSYGMPIRADHTNLADRTPSDLVPGAVPLASCFPGCPQQRSD